MFPTQSAPALMARLSEKHKAGHIIPTKSAPNVAQKTLLDKYALKTGQGSRMTKCFEVGGVDEERVRAVADSVGRAHTQSQRGDGGDLSDEELRGFCRFRHLCLYILEGV